MVAAPSSRRQLLPHPCAEPARQLLLVEGEPDMLAARSHGLRAIALPGVESWKPDWASRFADRHVDIIMDADRPGRAAADQIARDLASIADARILEIAPNRADGYDLTDWLVEKHRAGTSPYDALLASCHPSKGGDHETYV
jgi:putative DNA primase/helicase